MSFPTSLSSGFGELAGAGLGEVHIRHVFALGNGSVCFLGPENKRKIKKRTVQMAALVKAEDVGD